MARVLLGRTVSLKDLAVSPSPALSLTLPPPEERRGGGERGVEEGEERKTDDVIDYEFTNGIAKERERRRGRGGGGEKTGDMIDYEIEEGEIEERTRKTREDEERRTRGGKDVIENQIKERKGGRRGGEEEGRKGSLVSRVFTERRREGKNKGKEERGNDEVKETREMEEEIKEGRKGGRGERRKEEKGREERSPPPPPSPPFTSTQHEVKGQGRDSRDLQRLQETLALCGGGGKGEQEVTPPLRQYCRSLLLVVLCPDNLPHEVALVGNSVQELEGRAYSDHSGSQVRYCWRVASSLCLILERLGWIPAAQ